MPEAKSGLTVEKSGNAFYNIRESPRFSAAHEAETDTVKQEYGMNKTVHAQSNRGNRFRLLGKIVLAGILAFALLEGFCRIYFNKPVHSATPGGPTDYVWEPHSFYSVWTEGIGFGRTNNEGYYDRTDFEAGTRADILVMGSSFMMAEQVRQNQSAAALLQEAFPQVRVYNIGMAGHHMLTCLQNLKAACEKYRPRYVIIDSQALSYSDEELQMELDGAFPEEQSNDNALLLLLKKSALLNLLYYQATFYREAHGGLFSFPQPQPLFSRSAEPEKGGESEEAAESEAAPAQPEETRPDSNRILLEQVLRKAQREAAETGTEIIVVFHPKTWLDGYGGVLVYDTTETEDYDSLYEDCGIHLLNMSGIYRERYEEDHVLPYGFCNTAVGMGHLNTEGHRMIAGALAGMITELDR